MSSGTGSSHAGLDVAQDTSVLYLTGVGHIAELQQEAEADVNDTTAFIL